MEEEAKGCELFRNKEDKEGMIQDTLSKCVSVLEKTGASGFALSVI